MIAISADFSAARAVFAALAIVAAAPAFAQNLNERGICPGVQVYSEDIPVRLMKVVATTPRVNFIEDQLTKPKSACPSDAAACKRKGFVVPGDEVLAGWTRGGFICVTYVSPNAKRVKGQFPETSGYLPAGALQPVPPAPAKPADWLGKWSRSAEAEIEISAGADGKVKIAGQAVYGSLDPGRVARGAVNSGELEGEGAPRGNLLAVGEDYTDPAKPLGEDRSECRARLQLIGRYLLVEDNMGCGGMNVSFTGIYVRLK
jgi:hypothetical protein